MSSFHFHQELPSWAQAVLNWALLASFIIQLCSIVLNCTHLCSIVLNCLNCAQLCSIVLNCAQLCSTVHNCAQLCSTVLKCAQLGLILLNLAFLRIWWTTTTTTKVFSWSASLCERLKSACKFLVTKDFEFEYWTSLIWYFITLLLVVGIWKCYNNRTMSNYWNFEPTLSFVFWMQVDQDDFWQKKWL